MEFYLIDGIENWDYISYEFDFSNSYNFIYNREG